MAEQKNELMMGARSARHKTGLKHTQKTTKILPDQQDDQQTDGQGKIPRKQRAGGIKTRSNKQHGGHGTGQRLNPLDRGGGTKKNFLHT